jgi:predicted N-acetyltransferase YhbS
MVEKAIIIAKEMGFKAVFLCGNAKIYGRLGFSPSFNYNIFHKNDEARTAEWSMVRELYDGALNNVSGIVDTV